MKNNKKKILMMIFLSLFSIAILSFGTYAIWTSANDLLTGSNTIQSGQVKMSYSESNEIGMNNALPIKDSEGKVLTNYFDFKVLSYIKTRANDDTQRKLNYNIVLEPITVDNPLSDNEIKVYLTKVEGSTETVVVEPTTIDKLNQYVLKSQEEIFSNNKKEVTTSYRLRAWIDASVDTNKFNEKKYSYKFRVNINNEAAPVKEDYALTFAKSKVGTDGLERITHTIDNTLQVDSKFATEYRYRGGNVANYVTFNNETWRIIGIIPTEDTDGNVENRFKIIRDASIGGYNWDSDTAIAYNYESDNSIRMLQNYSINSNDINDLIYYNDKYNYNVEKTVKEPGACTNCGNNWARPSTLNTYLNETYYNTLSSDAKNMIGTTKYYLGGYRDSKMTSDVIWQYERKNEANRTDYYYGTNPIMQNDANKKIALMYASDYGYAASKNCSKDLYHYNEGSNCITANNWLDKSQYEWLLPQNSDTSLIAFYVNSSGLVNDSNLVSNNERGARPVLSLSSNVKISSGNGTSESPYKLTVE